ncbi:hypothetical protein ES707_18764 [subsurface metagenome]
MDIETLRPVANGTFQEHNYQYPAEGEHYDKINEVTPDDSARYIGARHTYSALTDTFVIPPHQQGNGLINSVTVYGRFRNAALQNGRQSVVVYTHGTLFSYNFGVLPSAWTTQGYSWDINPYTGEPWTWEEIDNLEIGIIDRYHGTYCSQVYVEVDYTPVSIYHLDLTINGEGLVLPEDVSGDYPEGTVIELGAYPASGWRFHSWEGTDNDLVNPTTVTMDRDRPVIAHFTQEEPVPPPRYTLTITIAGDGTVDPAGGEFEEGTVVELTAYPAPGWLFHSWGGTDNDAVNPTTVTMDRDRYIVCNFTKEAPVGCLPVVAGGILLVAGIIAGIIIAFA